MLCYRHERYNSSLLGAWTTGLGESYSSSMASQFFETAARVESGIINAAPASLREVSGFNDGLSTLYFQLFDKTTAPVNPDVPIKQVRVPAGANFAGDFRDMLRLFPTGLSFGFSTTADVFTGGAGPIGHVEAVFED